MSAAIGRLESMCFARVWIARISETVWTRDMGDVQDTIDSPREVLFSSLPFEP